MKFKRGKKYLLYNMIILITCLLFILIENTYFKDYSNEKNMDYGLVTRIVDGDTIVVLLNNREYKVRLIGVDTPEISKRTDYYGNEAKEYTEKRLLNKYVYLEKDISETDKYNRLLRYVWLEKPHIVDDLKIRNKLFNAQIIIDGYASISTYQPDVKYVDYFKLYNSEARDKKIGLWNKE
jgi:micrococcal nuclease